VPVVALANPKSELWYSEISVGGAMQDPRVQRVAVYEEVHLSAAHTHRHLVPPVVGQPVRECLNVHERVLLRCVVQPDLVLSTATLQFQIPEKQERFVESRGNTFLSRECALKGPIHYAIPCR